MRGVLTPLFFAVVLLAPPPAVNAVHKPRPYVSVGAGGLCYFKMMPNDDTVGTGVAYLTKAGIFDKPLWVVSGWYAWDTFLSEDGHYLVRIGDPLPVRETYSGHLAIAFYADGKLLAQYSTRDLIKDATAMPLAEEGCLFWKHDAPHGFVTSAAGAPDRWFEFETSDSIRYTFDRETGAMVSAEQLSK